MASPLSRLSLSISPSIRPFSAELAHRQHPAPRLSILPLMPLVVTSLALLARDIPVALRQHVFSSHHRLLVRDMSPAVIRRIAMPETFALTTRATLAKANVTMAARSIPLLSSGMFLLPLCILHLWVLANMLVNSTNSALPYCNTISFPGDIMDVFCNNAQITEVQAALTTYRGESSRRFSPLTLTSNSPQSTVANEFTSSTESSSSSTSETAPATTTPAPSSGGGGSSNTGAIVGGVVGGVGGLALIGLAAFFFLRRKKTHTAVPQEQTPQVPPVYPTPPGMQQTPQGPYDPKFAAATAQYPQYQQGYYPTPEGHTISPVDPRYSTITSSTSPVPSGGYAAPGPGPYQPQENVIHEAPAQGSENHRGEMHELA